jgi:hypothetical protein
MRERDERRREGDARSDEDADGAGEAVARAHFRDAGTAPGEEIVVGWQWDDANAMHRGCEVAGLEVCVSSLFFSSSSSLPLLSVLCVSYLL